MSWKTDKKVLARTVKGLLVRASLNQRELALGLGVSQKAIQNYTKGANLVGNAAVQRKLEKLLEKFPEDEATGTTTPVVTTPAEDKASLVERLKQKQQELGKNNLEMAELLGVNVSGFQNWMAGRNAPTKKKNVVAIQKLLGDSPADTATNKTPFPKKNARVAEQGFAQLRLEFEVQARQELVRKALAVAAARTGHPLPRHVLRDFLADACGLLAPYLSAAEIADTARSIS